MYKIFLSYSRKDYNIVREIKQEIEQVTKAKCWMDLDGISYESPDFTKIIAPAIEQASIFVFILTPNSQEARYARNELLLAQKRNKHIFLIEPRECELTSEFILEYGHYNRNLYYVDYQKTKLFEEISKLLNSSSIEENEEIKIEIVEGKKTFRLDKDLTDKTDIIDDAVSDDTEMVVATRQKTNSLNLPFIPYNEFKKQDDVCPNCGKNPCVCKNEVNEKVLFVAAYENKNKYNPYYDIEIFDEEKRSLLKVKGKTFGEIEKVDGHDVLFIEEDISENQRRYDIVSVDSIKRSLLLNEIKRESDEDLSDEDIRKLEKFFPQYKGGLEYIGKSEDDYLLYASKEDPENCESVDIITSTGTKLFTLKREDETEITKVTPSGLLLMEKIEGDGTSYYGIADKHGEVLLPCLYGKHNRKNDGKFDAHEYYASLRRERDIEILPGIFKFYHEDYYINAYTKEQYVDVVGKYALRMKSKDDYNYVDIVCIENSKVIKEGVTINEDSELKWLGDGWYMVDILERNKKGLIDEISFVFNMETMFTLEKNESIIELPNDNGDTSFLVNNGRIVSAKKPEDCDLIDASEIILRDYKGNLIRSIQKPQLELMQPYMFDKLIAFKFNTTKLVYLDLQGEEHVIPFDMSHYINCRNARFVSETTISVEYGYEMHCVLIDVNGNVLLDKERLITTSSDNYLEFREKKKYGIADTLGNIILNANYSGIYVMR